MKNKRKNNSGITLVALIITIIVMIILASVSIMASIGEDGILTKAKETQELAKSTQNKEKLEEMLMGFYASEYADVEAGLEKYLQKKVEGKSIDSYVTSTDGDTVIVKKKDEYYQWVKDEEGDDTSYVITNISDAALKLLKDEMISSMGKTPSVLLTQKTLNDNPRIYICKWNNISCIRFRIKWR